MGFQNANENEFDGFGDLVIWIWQSFRKIFTGVCTNPISHPIPPFITFSEKGSPSIYNEPHLFGT